MKNLKLPFAAQSDFLRDGERRKESISTHSILFSIWLMWIAAGLTYVRYKIGAKLNKLTLKKDAKQSKNSITA